MIRPLNPSEISECLSEPMIIHTYDAFRIAATFAYLQRLESSLLKIATIAGADTSDIDRPDMLLSPKIDDLAIEAVRDLRSDWVELSREVRS